MSIKRILVPFDISDHSFEASNEAIEYAKSSGASINFIHIVDPKPYNDLVYDSPQADAMVEDEMKETTNKWFSKVADKCAQNKVPNKMEILFERGSVVETIINYANNMNADLIVIWHSSAHGFGRHFKADVAKEIIDKAIPPCSIMVVKRQ
jgi:nucleotide-binding universal stress UspA family protein